MVRAGDELCRLREDDRHVRSTDSADHAADDGVHAICPANRQADLADLQPGILVGERLAAVARNAISGGNDLAFGFLRLCFIADELSIWAVLHFPPIPAYAGLLFSGPKKLFPGRVPHGHRLWAEAVRRAISFVFCGETPMEGFARNDRRGSDSAGHSPAAVRPGG